MIYPANPQLGRWYIAVTCEKCKSKLVLFPDLTEGKSDLQRSGYSLICPRCKDLTDGKAEHYQHRERRRPALLIEIL
jgi:hypothetical protein